MNKRRFIGLVLLGAIAFHLGLAVWCFIDPMRRSLWLFASVIDNQYPKRLQVLIPTTILGLLYLVGYLCKKWRFNVLFMGTITEALLSLSHLAAYSLPLITKGASSAPPEAGLGTLFEMATCFLMWRALKYEASFTSDRITGSVGESVTARSILRQALATRTLSSFLAVMATVVLGVLCFLISVNGLERYGIALFVTTPILLGIFSALLHSLVAHRSLRDCVAVSICAVGIAFIVLLTQALEGAICILMALPLMMVAAALGGLVGFLIQDRWFSKSRSFLLSLIVVNPFLLQIDRVEPHSNRKAVRTQIVVHANPAEVWKVFDRPLELSSYTHTLDSIGFSVPRFASLQRNGESAVLRCGFRGGEVDFPVDRLVPHREIRFLPMALTPSPMKELSIYEQIDAPHLHGYFTVEFGSLVLTPIAEKTTVVEATTEYTYRIAPAAYWNWWTEMIIDTLHTNVLKAIKATSESNNA